MQGSTAAAGKISIMDKGIATHLEYVMDDVHVLHNVVGSVDEEACGHTVKAAGLVLSAVHLHKVSSTHGQQTGLLH